MSDGDRWVRAGVRLYRAGLRLYPRRYRRRFGDDQLRSFADQCRDVLRRRGPRGLPSLWLGAFLDLTVSAIRERLTSGRIGRLLSTRTPARFLDSLGRDLRYAARTLLRRPGFTGAAVVTLGLGIGAVTSIYSVVDALLLGPLPLPEVERVVVLGETTPRRGVRGEGWMHASDFEAIRELEAFDSVAALRPWFVDMTGVGDPVEVIGYRATPEFFRVLGVEPLVGRTFALTETGADDVPGVVLGQRFWQRRFAGDPDVLGETVRLDGRPVAIVGVLPRDATYPLGTDLWVPMPSSPAGDVEGNGRVRVVGRLASGISVREAGTALELVARRLPAAHPGEPGEVGFGVIPIRESVTYRTGDLVGILFGAAGFLLLLVCANVATMQLARSARRRREIAVRLALGARRGRLVRQLLTEGTVMASLGAAAGVLFATWGIRYLRAVLSGDLLRFYITGVHNIALDGTVLAVAVGTAGASTLMFGLVPAIRASRVELTDALSADGGRHTVRGGGRLRRGLVVLEVALSVVLLCGAGLAVHGVGALSSTDGGFDGDVTTFRVRLRGEAYETPGRVEAFIAEWMEGVGSLPGVRAVAVADGLPGAGGSYPRELRVEGGPASATGDANAPRARRRTVGGDYFETLDIPLLAGRSFATSDRADAPPVAVVSAALAERLAPGGAPAAALGRRIRFAEDRPWTTVVGVVGNVIREWNDARPARIVYVHYRQQPRAEMWLLVTASGDGATISPPVRRKAWAIDDTVPVGEPATVAEAVAERSRGFRLIARVMSGFAGVAFLLCIGGIYALVSYSAAERSREMGVRVALGAGRNEVLRLLVGSGLKTAALGLAVGLPVAYGLGRLMASLLVGVVTVDAGVFAFLIATVLAVTAVAAWIPARRAARLDPVEVLRTE